VIKRQVGNPVILGDDEMAIVLGKFKNYGKQPDEINSLSIPAVEAPERRFWMIDLFGTLANGDDVKRIMLKKDGLRAWIITHGASLHNLKLDHHPHSLVLGFKKLDHYIKQPGYFGPIVGRVANRIAGAKVAIGNKTQWLDANENGIQVLHGGSDGTSARNWKIRDHGSDYVVLEDHLPHLHMGFQGALDVTVTYEIVSCQGLKIEITASSDQDTLCNFAHHSYFNLDGSENILDHLLQIDAENYLPVNENLIPVGICEPVEDTPFDFRKLRPVAWLNEPYDYDHNYCLSKSKSEPRPVARLQGPLTGLEMTILTTEPGLQVYDGRSAASVYPGHNSKPYKNYAGIALEPQFWPDAPNHTSFPDIMLRAGEQYQQTTVFKFA